MVVAANVDDLLVSAAVTGTPASWLKPSLTRTGFDVNAMPDKPARDYDSSRQGAKRWKDVWSAGQGVGAIRSIEPVSVVVERLAQEYDAAFARVAALANCGASHARVVQVRGQPVASTGKSLRCRSG
jgi:nitronate monooxygenase